MKLSTRDLKKAEEQAQANANSSGRPRWLFMYNGTFWISKTEVKEEGYCKKFEPVQYSFCESVTATSISPWCIRPLTEQGMKLSGGVDTPSLCGRVETRMGWDVANPVDVDDPKACPKCVELLKQKRRRRMWEIEQELGSDFTERSQARAELENEWLELSRTDDLHRRMR